MYYSFYRVVFQPAFMFMPQFLYYSNRNAKEQDIHLGI